MFHFYEKVREIATVSNEKITVVKGKEIIKTDQANAKMLNNFFTNIIKDLEIPQYNQIDPICQNIIDPVIKAIIKYRNHPRIIAIKERCSNLKFSSSFNEKDYTLKEIKNLQINMLHKTQIFQLNSLKITQIYLLVSFLLV